MLVLLPCRIASTKGKDTWGNCAFLALTHFGSVVSVSGALALTPLEVILPEVNIKLLKMHKWGPKLVESEGERITGSFVETKYFSN
jgi:hypothetical protein